VPLSPDPSLSNFLAVYQSQTSLACLKNPQLVVKDQKTPPKNDRMADRPTPGSGALARFTKTSTAARAQAVRGFAPASPATNVRRAARLTLVFAPERKIVKTCAEAD
jgi:hypothetical protein